MSLPAYGLLVGKIVGSRPQAGGHPHWLLMVQSTAPGHPPYRVAVNLESADPAAPPEIEYQVIDVASDGLPGLKTLVDGLKTRGATDSFLVGADLPTLDFVRGGLVDAAKFQTVAAGNPLKTAFQQALDDTAALDEQGGALIAVFGTGYPVNPATARSPSTGYTGVDNIHMNQGSPNRTGAGSYYRENGANQDGGLIFLLPTGARAFFVKFQSQSLLTDRNGNPTTTGVPEIDTRAAQVTTLLANDTGVQSAISTAKTQTAVSGQSPGGFVFADPGPDDITGQFLADDDGGAFSTPFVMQYAKGQTRGPVPAPRAYPLMQLTDVVGAAIPGYVKSANGDQTIAFDLIGDSGAATQAKLPGETAVGELLAATAKASQPAFLFHVGDVVYYYGEKQFYYGQFADIFKDYPAPIFAIPGNHDGLIHDPSMVSLESFQAAFCAAAPGRWDGFGGIARSTMTQPGVYFTLEAPLVSIVGLYSNCGESLGWVDQQQLTFLHAEFTRFKALKAQEKRAVIFAIHHMPRWIPSASTKDPTSAAIDAVCTDVGFWPDAVVVGHAHLYQRIVRQVGGRSIPYFVNGGGGYGIEALQEVGKAYIATLPKAQSQVVLEEGFLRATVTASAGAATLTFDYHSVKRPLASVADTYTVTL
jgi:hypothetical protein